MGKTHIISFSCKQINCNKNNQVIIQENKRLVLINQVNLTEMGTTNFVSFNVYSFLAVANFVVDLIFQFIDGCLKRNEILRMKI